MFATLKSTQHKCRTNVNIRVQGLWQIRKTHRRGPVITSGTLQQQPLSCVIYFQIVSFSHSPLQPQPLRGPYKLCSSPQPCNCKSSES